MFCQIQNDDLAAFQKQQSRIQQQGMWFLGSWAMANIGGSGYMMTQTEDSRYYFHQMNVYWNLVNMGIAVTGYFNAPDSDVTKRTTELYRESNDFSKLLLLNTGLDVAYITTGLYLKEKAKNHNKRQSRYKGYGNSLMLQGGFLLVFDVTLFILNESSINDLHNSESIQITLTPASLYLSYKF